MHQSGDDGTRCAAPPSVFPATVVPARKCAVGGYLPAESPTPPPSNLTRHTITFPPSPSAREEPPPTPGGNTPKTGSVSPDPDREDHPPGSGFSLPELVSARRARERWRRQGWWLASVLQRRRIVRQDSGRRASSLAEIRGIRREECHAKVEAVRDADPPDSGRETDPMFRNCHRQSGAFSDIGRSREITDKVARRRRARQIQQSTAVCTSTSPGRCRRNRRLGPRGSRSGCRPHRSHGVALVRRRGV